MSGHGPVFCERKRIHEQLPRLVIIIRGIVVDEVLRGPAVEIIFGHALLGELLETHIGARGHRAEKRITADLLMTAAVVDFVKLVA